MSKYKPLVFFTSRFLQEDEFTNLSELQDRNPCSHLTHSLCSICKLLSNHLNFLFLNMTFCSSSWPSILNIQFYGVLCVIFPIFSMFLIMIQVAFSLLIYSVCERNVLSISNYYVIVLLSNYTKTLASQR